MFECDNERYDCPENCTGCMEKKEVKDSPASLIIETSCDNCSDDMEPGDFIWHLRECDLYLCAQCMEDI